MESAADMLAALRLQIEWGADEALEEAPVDRLVLRAPAPAPQPIAPPPAAAAPPRRAAPVLLAAPAQRAQELAMAADTLEALRAAMAGFDGCPLAATATKLVFADGNPASRLMLIGEAPGAEEDRTGLPFVGPAGQLLDRMLASIGLDRTQYYITNILPWRPPGNRNPTDAEILTCLPFLHRHIALVRPRQLLLLGKIATTALTGTSTGILKMRGKTTLVSLPGDTVPIPALPTLHPSYLLRTPGAKRDAWADLLLLRRTIDQLS